MCAYVRLFINVYFFVVIAHLTKSPWCTSVLLLYLTIGRVV